MRRIITLFALFQFIGLIQITAQTATLEATVSLKNVNGIMVPYQNGIPIPSFEKQSRTIISLEGEWKKDRFNSNVNYSLSKRDSIGLSNLISESGGRYLKDFDDSGWSTKILPAVENEMYTFPTVPEYYENGVWYRRSFNVDPELSGKQVKLMCSAINYIADVWINGEYVGYHEGGYTPFAFDITDQLIFGESNIISIRVDNPEWGSRKDIVPFYKCDWFNYTGIIHDIYLEVNNKISVVRADLVTRSSEGEIEAKIIISNKNLMDREIIVEAEIYSAVVDSTNIQSEYAFDLVGDAAQFTGNSSMNILAPADSIGVWKADLRITHPRLWSPKTPNLYIFKITLKFQDNIVDEYYTQFGLRVIETKGDKVLLNNHVVFLTGAARHEDHPVHGRSIPKNIIYSDLVTVKDANINFLRSGHYPNNLYTYLIADRIGLTVMEEIPVWWFDSEEPWQIQNNQRHIHEQMFREMVFKDYNRPSIILWSTSNECKETANRLIYNEVIKNDITKNYNDYRLLSQSSAGDNPGYTDATQTPLDVAGWTLYFGIFHGSTYYAGTLIFLINAKAAFPGKPLIDTEFGYWSGESGNYQSTQNIVFDETFKALKFFSPLNQDGSYNQNGMLMAATWWCVFDWYSHQHPRGYQSMGLISMDRSAKKTVYDKLKNSYSPYFNSGGMVVTDVKETWINVLSNYNFSQNYPNPFNPNTVIKFQVPSSKFVKLQIHDILGREVQTLVNAQISAGEHEVTFNGSKLPSGFYIYTIKVNEFTQSRKMLLLK
ncbi:MAG: T9SS type A sorting domain-containing protein [Bacteroidetes bacterium]|nr:T9SS type A sorting domain-containing protein [Bacteroidota bacterium]